MDNSIKVKKYWIKIIPMIIWQFIYLILCNLFDKNTRVYCDLVFYLVIAIYFFLWREWRFLDWGKALKSGKSFWFPVLFTALGMAAMFCVGIAVTIFLPDISDGMAVLGVNNWPTLIAFSFVTVFLPPIAEESFYRKAITAFDSKTVLIISVILSVFLYASEHSLVPLGFFQACLWAIPLSVAFIKTKNIYVCMTAHFLCNFVMNGITVVSSAIGLSRI